MHITAVTRDDIPALVPLVNSAYRGGEGARGWTDETHLLSGPRTDAAALARLLEQPGATILRCADTEGPGGLAGCVYLSKQDGRLYLGMLSVWPALQGKGIGKRLLAAAVDHARAHGCEKIRITVISARTELVAWYERHGYERTGEIEPFHSGGKFGKEKQPLELVVLERRVEA